MEAESVDGEDRITVKQLSGMAWFLDGTVCEYDPELGKWVVVEAGEAADRAPELLSKWDLEYRA